MLYHKIARGLVNSEKRDMLKAEDQMIEMQRKLVLDPIGRRILESGRKFEQGEIRRMCGAFVVELKSISNVLSVTHTPSQRTVSQTQFRETIDLSLMAFTNGAEPGKEQMMLARERIEIRPKLFRTTTTISPIDFTDHAYQRLLQRNETRKGSIKQMLAEVDAKIGLLMAMLGPGCTLPEQSIAFPVGDGLLLGNIVDAVRGRGCDRLTKVTEASVHGVEHFIEKPPNIQINPATKKATGFLARTYISAAEMRMSQKELHASLIGIFNNQREVVVSLAELCAFPDAIKDLSEDEVSNHFDEVEVLQGAIIDLFMQPRMAKAMGNSREPATRPLPTLTAYINEKTKREQMAAIGNLLAPRAPSPFAF